MLPSGSWAIQRRLGFHSAFGVEESLNALLPEVLNNPLQRRPVETLELLRGQERHAPAVHPQTHGQLFVGIGGHQGDFEQVGSKGLARLFDFLRLAEQVHAQAFVAAELVGQDIQRGFEDACHAGTTPHSRRSRSI